MFERLLAADNTWNWFALEIAIKGTLLLLLAALLVLALQCSSAAVRHSVWALTFVGLLLLPVVQFCAPGWRWQVIPAAWQPTPVDTVTVNDPADATPWPPARRSPIDPSDQLAVADATKTAERSPKDDVVRDTIKSDERPIMPEPAVVAPSSIREATNTESTDAKLPWLAIAWLIGAVVAAVPLGVGLVGNLRLRFCGKRVVDLHWQELVNSLSAQLDLRRRVTLIYGDADQMPMTFGFLRPHVVLPSTANVWSAERRAIVLLHELAHVKRYDVPLQLIARVAAAVYWFHPLVWWALRQMRQQREHACDDCVLQAGQQAPDYASQLLEIARSHRSRPMLNAALSMARRSQLEGRLLAVLDLHRRRTGISRAAAIQLAAVALAIVACIGIVRPTSEAEATASSNDDDPAVADDPSKPDTQMVLTGTVLSPQGKPVPNANVEVIAYNRHTWRHGADEDRIDHYQTKATAYGQFKLDLPRNVSRLREYTRVIASADGHAPGMQTIQSTLSRKHVEIRLEEPRVLRLQLIDTAGNPIANVQPRLWSIFGTEGHRTISAWPRFSRSDADGFVSGAIPASWKTALIFVEHERLGDHLLVVEVSDKLTSVAIKPAQFVHGKVTMADTGKPISGAEVVLLKEPYRRVRTGDDGSFRIASGTSNSSPYPGGQSRNILHIYPPPDSPYLAKRHEWEWPDGGLGDAEVTIVLERGTTLECQVVEKGSGKPVVGAAVYFEQQEKGNPFFRANATWGTDMTYKTDGVGRVRLPVWPGPGYVLLRAPTLDFVHTQITYGDRYYGKRGLYREYYDAAIPIDLNPDEPPQPIKIELERGVTFRRRVVRPDGRPAHGKAFARSYLAIDSVSIRALPPIPVENGILELPGFDPERSKPIFIVDPEGNCAAVVSPAASETELESAPVQLQPFGAAKFRFVTDKGASLADYEPSLHLIVTPGAPETGFIQPDQPVWRESISHSNVVYWANETKPPKPLKISKTDSDGRVTFDGLIPGATYDVQFWGRDGVTAAGGYEFTVRSGETTDVGEIVIPERDE